MKLFVRNDTHALDWERAADPSSTGPRRSGGRVGRLADLYEWMLPLAGLLFLADVFSLIHLWPPLQYLLAGIVLGAFGGRSVVVWRERDGQALHPDLVRRIEHSWTLAGVALTMLMLLVQVVLV
jgi:hypothetical protein